MHQGYLLSNAAMERGREFIKSRRARMVRAEALARRLQVDMRPVTPWAGCTPTTAALAAARSLLWEACQRGELREVQGAWGRTYWQVVR
jgi:hypothetical protein